MRAEIYPLQMLLLTVSGWVHRHQADVIAYLVEENRVLKDQMKGRALQLNDEASLRRAISEYVEHYHVERAHQGIGNEHIEHHDAVADGEVVCDERLGGLLKCYRRAA